MIIVCGDYDNSNDCDFHDNKVKDDHDYDNFSGMVVMMMTIMTRLLILMLLMVLLDDDDDNDDDVADVVLVIVGVADDG